MANYTYECKHCGVFNAEHSIKQDAYKVCPKCGGKDIKRLIGSNTAFILKGSGFYDTDYKHGAGSEYAAKKAADHSSHAPSCHGCDKAGSGKCKG
jgi:putative FmdB family regulatory protein